MKSVKVNAIVGKLSLGVIISSVIIMNTAGVSYEVIAFPILMICGLIAFVGVVLSYIMDDDE